MKVVFLYHYYEEKIKDKHRTEFPPLGMLYLCSVIENMNHEVEVFYFDEYTPIDQFPCADVYAYSISSTVNYPVYLKRAPELRDKAKFFCAGNTHASIFPEKVLEELKVDVVFVGESEVTMSKWIESGMKEKGIIRGKRNKNLNFPFPARHLLPDNKIYMSNRVGGPSNHSISMISSRGCVFKCAFCAIQQRGKVVFRDTSDFRDELLHIKKEYPLCDGITLLDETFTLNKDHAISIANVFKNLNMPYECNSRADTLGDDIIKALGDSPCKEIRIGLESGSQQLVDAMNKGINLDETKEILKKLAQNEIPVKIYLMHGFPGENKSTTLETINYINEMKNYINRISLYRFTPLPGSPIFEKMNFNSNWKDYTIYDNNVQWWGSEKEFIEVCDSYEILRQEVDLFNKIR